LKRRDEGGDRSRSGNDGDTDIERHTGTQLLAATEKCRAHDVDATLA
jgi:hypothetical protein